MEILVRKLKNTNIRIGSIKDENWASREALKEINEALIEFFENI